MSGRIQQLREDLVRFYGVPMSETEGMTDAQLVALGNKTHDEHNARVLAAKSDAISVRHARLDTDNPQHRSTPAMNRAQAIALVLSHYPATDRAYLEQRSDEYLSGRVDVILESPPAPGSFAPRHDETGDLAALVQQFDAAASYPELYAHADAWRYGDDAAHNAAMAAMKGARR